MLEPYVIGERVCITHPNGVSDEYFYFYLGVIEYFKICIPFTAFKYGLLQTLKISPSQLCPNGWGFVKVFELVWETMSITSTLGLFFSFF